ncbi:MAG: PASTA domain-containing protein, partial [Clostridia bacterium]|nr:PASTA domain-containing protein [Clostridia bacterium]
ALALSATVEDVCISPYHIDASQKEDENGKKAADESLDQIIFNIVTELNEVLGVDKAELDKKIRDGIKNSSKYLLVKKSVEKEYTSQIREFINDKKYVNYLYFQENTKRYYPLGSLASHVIGFCGVDGGLTGLELKYNEDLTGVKGKSISGKDGTGKDLSFKYESYVDAIDGYNLVTTIDYTVQGILEKYLKEAFEDNGAANRVAGIVMDVNTGEIYADATYPDFDLNAPFELPDYYQNILDEYRKDSSEEKTYGMRLLDTAWYDYCHSKKEYLPDNNTEENFLTCILNTMWNNKTVTEPYEPGSTFKIVTAAVALEESLVTESTPYVCKNGIDVSGFHIGCHKRDGHGLQTFAETLQNSCNPAFVTWGQKIGEEKFMQYLEEFGYVGNTGSDFTGARSTLYYTPTGANFGDIGLATYSFGQTFKTTMLQQIRAVSVVANGGKLVVPHLAKSLVDDNGNVIKTFEYSTERSVISESVSDSIVQILKGGAEKGTTKNATVYGYEVAAKTGTSQKRDVEEETYISSCVAFAPAADPQVAILIVVDEPTGADYYGGLVAAPVVSKVLTEALPALGIKAKGDDTMTKIKAEDYRGVKVDEATKKITKLGLEPKVIGDGLSVVSQVPAGGTQMMAGGTVILYTDRAEQNEVT